MATTGVLIFPGSNCDHDAYHALKHVMGGKTKFIWHKETDLSGIDLVIVPGGFSYGDYLRCGAIARFSPIMAEVKKFAEAGGPVVGICNGFQILLESGLLPGAMQHNAKLRFVCKNVFIRCENNQTLFTNALSPGQVLNIPVSHGEGNYIIDAAGLQLLEDNGQVLFRYCTSRGEITDEVNFNGSVSNIAGISNASHNVMGLMPHPERAMEPLLGSSDGIPVFESIFNQLSSV